MSPRPKYLTRSHFGEAAGHSAPAIRKSEARGEPASIDTLPQGMPDHLDVPAWGPSAQTQETKKNGAVGSARAG